jgi:hypothetical protein
MYLSPPPISPNMGNDDAANFGNANRNWPNKCNLAHDLSGRYTESVLDPMSFMTLGSPCDRHRNVKAHGTQAGTRDEACDPLCMTFLT